FGSGRGSGSGNGRGGIFTDMSRSIPAQAQRWPHSSNALLVGRGALQRAPPTHILATRSKEVSWLIIVSTRYQSVFLTPHEPTAELFTKAVQNEGAAHV